MIPDVNSKEELAEFLLALSQKLENGAHPLENPGTVDFIEAASAWIDSCDGFYENFGLEMPAQPDWKFIATIFKAACVYE
jgi:hypothetical protein